jgi:D-alanyl-D-alanine carboxypeptidase
MARRGKKINNLILITGLLLNVALFWGILQLWPRDFRPLPLSDPAVSALFRLARSPAVSPTPVAPPPRVIDGPRKIIVSAGDGQELVRIDGENYLVEPPWRGHALPRVIDPRYPGLVMLPLEMTFEQRKIYVTAATRTAFLEMAEAAAADGIRLLVDSGYRSVGYQRAIYRKRLAEGLDFAEISRSVAPPGYSEHMLGCTLDLVPSDWSFKGTPADKWLGVNAERFGFVQSYPANNPKGFAWEPWHWKYLAPSVEPVKQTAVFPGQTG